MRAWLDVQPLEHAVEVVNGAGVIVVDVDLGVARRHLEPQRSAAVEPRRSRIRSAIRIPVEGPVVVRAVKRIEVEGVVERTVDAGGSSRPADDDGHPGARCDDAHATAGPNLSVSVTAPQDSHCQRRRRAGERVTFTKVPPGVIAPSANQRTQRAKAEGNGCAVCDAQKSPKFRSRRAALVVLR